MEHFVKHYSALTQIPKDRFVHWIGIHKSRFFDWKSRHGQVNEHNARIPRDHWLHAGEKQAIIDFARHHPREGYRCLTFMMLEGCSRFIVHQELQESMKESEVELVLQRALEKFPGVRPRVISDNGPQFIARDFKIFIREVGMSHVHTSPYYPQSNGKLERYHKTLKSEGSRPLTPLSLADARKVIDEFVAYYNEVRLIAPSATSPQNPTGGASRAPLQAAR